MHALSKSHKSTICIVPPLAVQQAVQKIRCFKDKSFVRWPPHINLLYPFQEDQGSAFSDAALTAANALAQLSPFKVKLSSLSFFEHASSYTLWMDAGDKSGVVAVQAALQSVFPSCSDLSDDSQRGITAFTPHLSLGQWRKKQELLEALQEYSNDSELLNLQFEVNEVCICSRQGYRDPFTIRYAVPLGTATPFAPYAEPQLVDAPYIATSTRNLPTLLGLTDSPTDPRRFGLGGSPSGVWYFAFGANMNPKKLGGSRGLHPEESRPGVLKGYRLAFTHRGGFGTIMPAVQQATTAEASAHPAADLGNGTRSVATTQTAVAGVAETEAASAAVRGSPGEVHGLLHKLSPAELSDLMCMEHEYEPVVVMVQPYSNQQQQQQQQEPLSSQQQQQQQQQQLVPAIAFQSPPDRLIRDGLPPTRRYLDLMRGGAQHWKLDQQYTQWLLQHPEVADDRDRGPAYYTSPTGQPLPAWPKIRTGGPGQQQGGRQRGGRGAKWGAKKRAAPEMAQQLSR